MATSKKKVVKNIPKAGVGRKRKEEKNKIKGTSVYLFDKEKKYLVKEYGSLTAALLTLMPEELKRKQN